MTQVSGKRNWMDVTETGHSRREDLKKGRIEVQFQTQLA